MKKLMKRAMIYLCLGLAAGVFYREFTKWSGFSGRTTLAFMHPHLLVLGAGLCLVMALLSTHLPLFTDKRFNWSLRLHDIGLPFMALMLLVRGVLQVKAVPLSKGLDAAVSGLAGISHVILGVALVMGMLSLLKLSGQAEAKS